MFNVHVVNVRKSYFVYVHSLKQDRAISTMAFFHIIKYTIEVLDCLFAFLNSSGQSFQYLQLSKNAQCFGLVAAASWFVLGTEEDVPMRGEVIEDTIEPWQIVIPIAIFGVGLIIEGVLRARRKKNNSI